MTQHQLIKGPLLNEDGTLNEAGFAYSLVKTYSRKAIKVHKHKIKEWDYYYIGDQKYGLALTIADNSYMAMASISVMDFRAKKETTRSYIKWFTNGKIRMPETSATGSVKIEGKEYSLIFKNKDGRRHLVCHMDNFHNNEPFNCDVVLEDTTPHSMVIATPFNKKKHFYYNQKINLLSVGGCFSLGTASYVFNHDALAVLDWGRGVWTYKNTWYWSSFNAVIDDHRLGFNLGYGFGDTSAASENMLFYDKEVFKLDDVVFNIPKDEKGNDDFLKEWTMTSKKGDINLRFVPLLDRASDTNAIIIRSNQHQVFGKFYGSFKIDGREFKIDGQIGFAEKVMNRW